MPQETSAKIIATAERLFAHGGLEGVSLRKVASEAGVNSAAVHYHFGSRDALVEAVVLRRMVRIAKRRGEMLEALGARDNAPSVREILEVLVLPMAEVAERGGRAGRAYLRLLARLFSDRRDFTTQVIMQNFGETHIAIGSLLSQALPHVPQRTVHRRTMLAVEATLSTFADPEPFSVAEPEGAPPVTAPEIASELLDFLAGGLCAESLAAESSTAA